MCLMVKFVDGVLCEIEWFDFEIYVVCVLCVLCDFVLFFGFELVMCWCGFLCIVVDFVEVFGV